MTIVYGINLEGDRNCDLTYSPATQKWFYQGSEIPSTHLQYLNIYFDTLTRCVKTAVTQQLPSLTVEQQNIIIRTLLDSYYARLTIHYNHLKDELQGWIQMSKEHRGSGAIKITDTGRMDYHQVNPPFEDVETHFITFLKGMLSFAQARLGGMPAASFNEAIPLVKYLVDNSRFYVE